MKYKEMFTMSNGIFTIINYTFPDEGYTVSKASLDALFYMMFRNRELTAVFDEYWDDDEQSLDVSFQSTISNWFLDQYSSKWYHLIKDLIATYNPLSPINTSFTRNTEQNTDVDGSVESKVFGYNSSIGVDKDSSASSSTKEYSSTINEVRTGYNANTDIIKTLGEHIKLHEIDILKIMCYDVAEYILLPLFDINEEI